MEELNDKISPKCLLLYAFQISQTLPSRLFQNWNLDRSVPVRCFGVLVHLLAASQVFGKHSGILFFCAGNVYYLAVVRTLFFSFLASGHSLNTSHISNGTFRNWHDTSFVPQDLGYSRELLTLSDTSY